MGKKKLGKRLLAAGLCLLIAGTVNSASAYSVKAAGDVTLDAAHFPDSVFRTYLSDYADTNKDGTLSTEEIAALKQIDLENAGVKDLTGISYFPELERLDIKWNDLTELDVSQNTRLQELQCGSNLLTELDVSKNPALKYLNCGNLALMNGTAGTEKNTLTTLDLSHNPLLEWLRCENNQLTSVNVSSNPLLKDFDCTWNQLQTIDMSHNPLLQSLECGRNQLTTLDTSANTALTWLDCQDNNHLIQLDTSANKNLDHLNCTRDDLLCLNVGDNEVLQDQGFTSSQEYVEKLVTATKKLDGRTYIDFGTVPVDLDRVIPQGTGKITDGKLNYGYQDIDFTYDYIIGTENCNVTERLKVTTDAAQYYNEVQFVDDNGTVLSDQTVLYEGSAQAPQAPEKAGYQFTGWSYPASEYQSVKWPMQIKPVYELIGAPTEPTTAAATTAAATTAATTASPAATTVTETPVTTAADSEQADSDAVNTGDHTVTTVLIAALLLSASGVVLLSLQKKREDEE